MRPIAFTLMILAFLLLPIGVHAHPAVDEANRVLDGLEKKIEAMSLDDVKSKNSTTWARAIVSAIKDLKALSKEDPSVTKGPDYIAFMKRAVALSKTINPTIKKVVTAAGKGPRKVAVRAVTKLSVEDAKAVETVRKDFDLLVKRLSKTTSAELRDEVVEVNLRQSFDKMLSALDEVSAQEHPSVVKMQGALKKLQEKFDAIMAKVDKAPAPRSGTGFTRADREHAVSFQSLYKTVFTRLQKTTVRDLKDGKTSKFFEEKLGELKGHVESMSNADHPTAKAMATNLATLRGFYEKAAGKAETLGERKSPAKLPFADMRQVEIFQKEYNRVRATFDDIDLVKIQNPQSVAFLQGILDRLYLPITRISKESGDHPYVKTARKWHKELEDKMKEAMGKGKELAAGAGDVDEQLLLVREQFPLSKFSAKLELPHSSEAIENWAGTIKNWEKGAEGAVAFFQDAAAKSVKARSPEFQVYAKWFRGQVPLILKRERERVVTHLQGEIQIATARERRLEMDRLVNEGYATAATREIERGIIGAENLLAFERGYHGAEKAETKATLERLQKLMDTVTQHAHETQRQATIDRRMPAAASDDSELLEIVKTVIADKKYGIGSVERIVVHAPVKEIKAVDWWDGSWLKRHGKEFQATVAEKIGDRYFLRPVTCRFYWHTGRYAAPTNRWFCGGTWKGKEILAENIHK